MGSKKESDFAEVAVDRLFMESFANEASAYFRTDEDRRVEEYYERFKSRLKWHLSHSLSPRQKQVIQLYLKGKKEREIAEILGIKQQVVNIYKRRAINKLRGVLRK